MRKLLVFLNMLVVASIIISACASTPMPQPSVEETVTPTFDAPIILDPGLGGDTFVYATSELNIETFDPALAYDTTSRAIIFNVYETLIFYDGESTDTFVPMLASEMPTVSADGRTYTFKIRSGVKFHNGDEMTASDVAYSFQRGILQGGYSSPQQLLAEPFLGLGNDDITMIVDGGASADDRDALKANDPATLKAACEKVKTVIVADDDAGTVTMTLAQPWSPFLATIAQTWGSVMDQEWVVANGGWDGSCETWQNFYAMTPAEDPFSNITNGTGPFELEKFSNGEEAILSRNLDYWREPAKLELIVFKWVPEWDTRFTMMEVGDADLVDVPLDKRPEVDAIVGEFQVYKPALKMYSLSQAVCYYNAFAEGGDKFTACATGETEDGWPLHLYIGQPSNQQSLLLFNWNIPTSEKSPNPYIGSGKLDGNGIPPDFFNDVHIRKAFAYCIDRKTVIQDVFYDDAIQSTQLPLPGTTGYTDYPPHYNYNPAKCETEFKLADVDKDGISAGKESEDGGDVWNMGFRLQIVYPQSGTMQRVIAEILAKTLEQVNDKFMVETVGLLPRAYANLRLENVPLITINRFEEIHDPHNWFQPFTTGGFGRHQSLPKDLIAQFGNILARGVTESDPTKREKIYKEANQLYYDQCIGVPLIIETSHIFVQRWILGANFNPTFPGIYFYPIYKY